MSATCCGSSVMLVFSSSVKVYPIGKCSEVWVIVSCFVWKSRCVIYSSLFLVVLS